MPSIAIFGDSGMGKTMLMQKFCTDHPPRPRRRNRAISNTRPGASDDEQARRASLLCSNP
jgi:GTPase SAR1 family protein